MNILNKTYRSGRLFDYDMQSFNAVPSLDAIVSDCLSPYNGYPCRQCPNCIRKRSIYWSNRILAETYNKSVVIPFCLTYTEEMLEDTAFQGAFIGYEQVPDLVSVNGEVICLDTYRVPIYEYEPQFILKDDKRFYFLRTQDMQKFKKRVAINLSRMLKVMEIPNTTYKLRWFSKGEYGDYKSRPHWHCLLSFDFFDFPFDKLPPYAVETIAKHAILKAWNNAIYKDYKQGVDMSLAINKGKKVKVNPIVEFEPWKVDADNPNDSKQQLAKYLTKYISKASIIDMCPQAQVRPECFYCSTRYGCSFFDSQMPKIRKNVFSFLHWVSTKYAEPSCYQAIPKGLSVRQYICRNPKSLTTIHRDEFLSRFTDAVTCFNVDGDPIPIFPYIKKVVFCGYYVYPSLWRFSVKDRDLYKSYGDTNRVWWWNGEILPQGVDLNWMRDAFDLFQWCCQHAMHLEKQIIFEKKTNCFDDYRKLFNLEAQNGISAIFVEGVRAESANFDKATRLSDGSRAKRFNKIKFKQNVGL